MDGLKDIEKLEALADSIEDSDNDSDSDSNYEYVSVENDEFENEIDTGQDSDPFSVPENTERKDSTVKPSSSGVGAKVTQEESLEVIEQIVETDDKVSKKKCTARTSSLEITPAADVSEDDVVDNLENNEDSNEKLAELFLSVDRVIRYGEEEEDEDESEQDESEEDENAEADDPDFFAAGSATASTSFADQTKKSSEMVEVLEDSEDREVEDDILNEEELYSDIETEDMDEEAESFELEGPDEHEMDTQEDEDEDEEEEDEDDESNDIEANFVSLEYLNTNYKDFLKNVLTELTKELSINQNRQQEIDILLADKEVKLNKSFGRSESKHIAISRKAFTVFGYPYFKDEQMFYPPPNKDTLMKRQRKELDNWIEYPRAWTPEERKTLLKTCRTEARYKRFHRLYDEKEDLESQMRAIGITDYEKEVLEEKLLLVKHNIRQGINISDTELFGDRDEDMDWMKVSKTLRGVHNEVECKLQWKNLVHPAINRSPWTLEEDDLLKQLAEATDCREWDEIAQEMGYGRTAITCFQRFMQKHIPIKNMKNWSTKEDDRLIRLIHHCRINFYIPWAKIHYFMPGRTKDQCNQRYLNSLRDGIRKGMWTEAEEWLMIAGEILYKEDGNKVSELIPTRSGTQIHCHWNNYMKGTFKPWTTEEDILLLESVKKFGVKNWGAVAEVFNDETRNRARCRHRFEGIYRVFKKSPANRLDSLIYLDTNKYAAKRREQHYSSFESKLKEWGQHMDTEPVISNIPLANVDLNDKSTLPNQDVIENRILSKFIRHLQTLLPPLIPMKLGPLPKPKLRRFPDQVVDSLATRPISLGFIRKKLRKRMVARRTPTQKLIKIEGLQPKRRKSPTPLKSVMDHKITRLFRPSLVQRPGRYKVNHSEDELATLSITAKNLDIFLDFSSVKSNLDEITISKFSKGEQRILESFRFHSDITDSSESQVPPAAKYTKNRVTYRNTRKRRRTNEAARQTDGDNGELEQVNVIPPNKATLSMLRGALLHSDYTAEIARHIEPDHLAIVVKNTRNAAHTVVRRGVCNQDIMRRSHVGKSLFTSIAEPESFEMDIDSEQVEADRKLVSRLVQLFYLPGKMSLHKPDQQEDIFDDLREEDGDYTESEDTQLDSSIDAWRESESEDSTTQIGQEGPSSLKLRKLSTLQDQPLNLSMDHRIPSVMSICSDFSAPSTPATRTYSRKRKAGQITVPQPSLKLAFNELLSQGSERKSPRKMADVLGSAGQTTSAATGQPADVQAQPTPDSNVQPPLVPLAQGNLALSLLLRPPVFKVPIIRFPSSEKQPFISRPERFMFLNPSLGNVATPSTPPVARSFRVPFPIAPKPNSLAAQSTRMVAGATNEHPDAEHVMQLAGGATLIRKPPGQLENKRAKQLPGGVTITKQPSSSSGLSITRRAAAVSQQGWTPARQQAGMVTGQHRNEGMTMERAAQLVQAGHQATFTAQMLQQPAEAAAARQLAARAEFERQKAVVIKQQEALSTRLRQSKAS